MDILIADDDAATMDFIADIIEDNGDTVMGKAKNGEEAVQLFSSLSSPPDLIILDVHMPVMDGLASATLILATCRKKPSHPYIPILFLTGSSDEKILEQCFILGDDVMQKPISYTLTRAKINSLKRHLHTLRELQHKQRELEKYKSLQEEEFSLARDIFEHFMSMSNATSGNLRFHSSPSSTFNGDIVLCARSPMDSLYVLVGDLTGHGLPAAIAAIPITKIFFTMANKGISISKMAQEINQNLSHLLPDNIFCAAFLMEMSVDGKKLHLWSGGMPPIMITDSEGVLQQVIASNHMPLGSQRPEEFENNIQTLPLQPGSRLYFYTDGLTEAEDAAGHPFGESGLKNIFSQAHPDSFERILQEVQKFTSHAQQDDITLVEITAKELEWPTPSETLYLKQTAEKLRVALPWEIHMCVSGRDFQRGDPVSQLIQFLNNAIGIDIHQDALSTILTELYSNALEHGLMKLDSRLKSDEDGFVQYYLDRSEGLLKLQQETEYVDIKVSLNPHEPEPRITLSITDSGEGFDVENTKTSTENDLYGRGQKLIHLLCRQLQYSNGGRTATATYHLLQN